MDSSHSVFSYKADRILPLQIAVSFSVENAALAGLVLGRYPAWNPSAGA